MREVFGRHVEKWQMKKRLPTLEILGRQDDGTQVVVLDEALDLWRHLGSIPAHNQGLSNRPKNEFKSALRSG